MKKLYFWIGWVLIGLLAASTFGCATSQDRAAYHQAQVDAITAQMDARIKEIMNQKPMVRIEAEPGQQLTVSGLKRLEIYSPVMNESQLQAVRQYQDEYLPVYLSALNLMGIPVALGVQGYFMNENIKALQPGGNVIYGAGNTGVQGGSGNVMASPGGAGAHTGQQGNATGSYSPVTTETINPAP